MNLSINTSNLRIGQVIKNYKELCALLGEEVKTGKSKQLQIDNMKRFFEWEKAGQKFIITDIYDTPLPKVDGRSSGNYRAGIINTYNVPKTLSHKTGVYKIQKNNLVYIGSTKVGFRERYTQHCRESSCMKHTRNLLKNGGKYSIIWIANNNDTEQDIRKKEQYYLELYRSHGYTIINKEEVLAMDKAKVRTKNIKVKKEDYNKAIQILNDQNIRIIV